MFFMDKIYIRSQPSQINFEDKLTVHILKIFLEQVGMVPFVEPDSGKTRLCPENNTIFNLIRMFQTIWSLRPSTFPSISYANVPLTSIPMARSYTR